MSEPLADERREITKRAFADAARTWATEHGPQAVMKQFMDRVGETVNKLASKVAQQETELAVLRGTPQGQVHVAPVQVYPHLEIKPDMMPAVNLAGTDMEPVAKALRDVSKMLAELPPAVLKSPDPQITFSPEIAAPDLSPIAGVLGKLAGALEQAWDVQERLMVQLRERDEAAADAVNRLLMTMTARMEKLEKAVASAKDKPKQERIVARHEDDGTIVITKE